MANVNNVGKTSQVLDTTLGATATFTSSDSITILTGSLGLGFLLVDESGTIGAITSYTDETDFTVTTFAVSIDIETALNANY